jgi:copper chaperone
MIMAKHQFKTTIKCAGCLEKVTPFLNEKLAPEEWNVDIFTPSKILTVTSDKVTAEEVEEKVKQAGFQIEQIDQ